MDSLTHLVLGHAAGILAGGAPTSVHQAGYWGAFIGGSLPDCDWFLRYMNRCWSRYHRGATHSLPGVLVLSAAVAGGLQLIFPGAAFGYTYAWCVASALLHVFLDLCNAWGALFLWPVFRQRVRFDVVSIIDPWIIGLPLFGALGWNLGAWSKAGVAVAFGAVGLYIALKWLLKGRAVAILAAEVADQHHVMPWLGNLLTWPYAAGGPGAHEVGRVHLFPPRRVVERAVRHEDRPAIRATMHDERVQWFLQRARFPWAQVEETEGGYLVTWTDARWHITRRIFGRMRRSPMRLQVRLTRDLQVVQE